MTQVASNYGTVLYELGVDKDIVEETKKLFSSTAELPKMLQSPVVSRQAKHRIVDAVFPDKIRNFLKVLCDRQEVDLLEDIFCAYQKEYEKKNKILSVEMTYVLEPDEEQLAQIKAYLAKKYGKKEVQMIMKKDDALIGGFVLRVGDVEQDCSMRGRLKRLEKRLTWR